MCRHVLQADIFTAFLNRDIDGKLYEQWYKKCYKLQKGPFSLKPYSNHWHGKLKDTQKPFSFMPLESCKCIFNFKTDR